MSLRVALHHKTTYRYDRPVSLSPHIIRLRPAPHCRTPILGYALKVTPERHFLNWQQDPYGNHLARLVFPQPARELCVEVDLVAEMTVINPFDFFLDEAAEHLPFEYEPTLLKELTPYREIVESGPLLRELIEDCRGSKVRTIDHLVRINRKLHERIKYIIRLEPGIQKCEQTLELGSGSCRDSGWLLVQLLRGLGLAARFASGYLIQLKPDVKSLDGPSGSESDFTDLHAWAEVFLPGAGWIGLDPTSGLLTGEGHIPLACAADPISAAAITGSFAFTPEHEDDKVEQGFDFAMSVTRIHEDPRVTKPYTDEQWREIESLGHLVDHDLHRQDVRLTMGGEPTFISIDDMDGPEWNTAALGPTKRKLAGQLVRRLRERFSPGALLHFGQGKWYPGESLPRWSLGCYWRKDGHPIWRNPELIAHEHHNYGHNTSHALALMAGLARRLRLDVDHILPGFEDIWYHLWRERRLPVNVDPLNNRLSDPEERARLARVFEQGLDKVVGYALPLRPDASMPEGWRSGAWFFRPERMYLVPGDSPMGYRLPLDSLPWVAPADREYFHELDPMAERPPLPAPKAQRSVPGAAMRGGSREALRRSGRGWQSGQGLRELEPQEREAIATADQPAPAMHQSAPWIVRTAICVEPRDGRLHIFMPPLQSLEHYLDLVSALEDTAESLEMPVVIEGYHPPHDPRLNVLKVTPDPGVIEVNVHPARSWDELVQITTGLYEDARQSRLGTEKFMLDGRHTGTGGGNHIVLGGQSPKDSPFLRRPDLLKSMVAYWHNHPSLSYLFSSLFIGPTCQSPRVDEGRADSTYELQIAMQQVPDPLQTDPWRTPPWLVDRIFRNLLVDITGNTHRAEFCIDKLYSPESSSGRLGLVECRAFEMPPHARMSLAQQLLLRSMIAHFWQKPYNTPLATWGTQLHDRFLLPHFVREDFSEVLRDLREQSGYDIKPAWFEPHLEFRFPLIGQIATHNVSVELRQAIEPWHVMGEEPGGGGTVRYVDSSVERLQVLVTGAVGERHKLACNGRLVPLQRTGVAGQYVAGVRYRAWQPPACLHPTIGVHSPLIFDLVDRWQGRSLGGCTYHVAHPGGRNHTTFPVNSYEAQSRRVARFFPFGHTPGPMRVTPEPLNPAFPFTLDLRRDVTEAF